MTGRIEFRPALLVGVACACLAASAERQPKDELKAQREAVERARAEREADRQDENAEDEN